MSTRGHTLVVNNDGIGNGLIALPFLARLGRLVRQFRFWHTSNPVVEHTAFREHIRLRGFGGSVPSLWRRFLPDQQPDLARFLRSNSVARVINLRLNCIERDADYLEFKERMSPEIEFWDLYENGDNVYHQAIHDSIRGLFESHMGVSFSLLPNWLSLLKSRSSRREVEPRVVFYLGAKQFRKRWRSSEWQRLALRVIEGTPHTLCLLPGVTESEKRLAHELFRSLPTFVRERTEVIEGLDLWSLAEFIASGEFVVTHDTFVSHLSVALGIPVVVLFLATNSSIWGPDGRGRCEVVQSELALECDKASINGTCHRYYEECRGHCGMDVTADDVLSSLARLIQHKPHTVGARSHG